jgi:hypothetical protein
MARSARDILLIVPRWIARSGGYLLLAGREDALAAAPRMGRAWLSLMGVSLLWGVLAAWLWSSAWTVFGDYSGMHLMHTAVLLSVSALWLYRRGLVAVSECLGSASRSESLVTVVVVTVWTLMLVGLRRSHDLDVVVWPGGWLAGLSETWRHALAGLWRGLFPMVVQRVLILAPLWGAWGMLAACQFCHARERTSEPVAALARGVSAPALALAMTLPLGMTLLWLYFLGWWRLMVPGVTIVFAIAAGRVLCAREGGLTRRVLLAVNVLTQLVFLAAYLANR